MSDHVDLTDLRSITDGDRELEIALFQEFFSSSEQNIQTLTAHCTDGHNDSWRMAAHAFKGTALNLGAMALGDLCKKAQDNPAASAAKKKALIDAIQAEYAQVKAFLENVHS